MVSTSLEDKEVIDQIRAITGSSEGEVINILRSLVHCAVSSYEKDKKVTIPFFGNFKLSFEGYETNEDMTRTPIVTGVFSLNEGFKRNIGIISDWKDDNDDSKLLELDSYKHIRDMVTNSLKMASE